MDRIKSSRNSNSDFYMCYVNIYAAQHYTDPNLEQSEETKSEFSQSSTSEVGFYYSCLCEALQEYYCVYSHLSFASVELTSSVFHI